MHVGSRAGQMTDHRSGEDFQRPVPPLCVDLDGTLISGDLLTGVGKLLIKRNFLNGLIISFWFLRGSAVLRRKFAQRFIPNPASLTYDRDVIRWLTLERSSGRALWLCSALHEPIVASVAAHLGLFEGVLASKRDEDLTGIAMAERLVEKFGRRGFDYCANVGRDAVIWKYARSAIAIHGGSRLEQDGMRYADILRSVRAE